MAYDREKIYKQALKILQEKTIYTVQDLIDYLPCTKSTFYMLFDSKSDEMDAIRNGINFIKVEAKQKIRKTFMSELATPTERMFMYKILANDDEKRSLQCKGEVSQRFNLLDF